jgi:hypothetical protein
MGEKPEENREGCAEHKAGDDREIEGRVFAAVDDVAGKLSEAKGEFCDEVQKGADEDEKAPEEEENAAEFAKRFHPRILPEAAEKLFAPGDSC